MHGCFTALITPLDRNNDVDEGGLEKLIEFQLAAGVSGILAVGTTGESPTLVWEEHNHVVERVCTLVKGRALSIAGSGSNSTREALKATKHAADAGADAALVVDPYYNGPSSLEIRREYLAPLAAAVPNLQIIPYIIPGRSGTQLLPQDLAILASEFPNISTVKEATGDLDNMRRTRECCGPDFTIMSGDDNLLLEMMSDERIGAAGIISVMSNIAPAAMQQMTVALAAGDMAEATRLRDAMQPLFDIIGVATSEPTPFGNADVKARNPLPLKTLMNVLGMPSGPCRRPLGKMTEAGLAVVMNAARTVQANNPEIFAPIAEFFGVDVAARLADDSLLGPLSY
jgi:4-hydroxy-tetrahydrodipicolinate synthase